MAPALVTAAIISSRNEMIGSAEVAGRRTAEITNVPDRLHTIAMPSNRPASEAPIIAKLFVAAKLEPLPPVLMSRYSAAVTISQKISNNSKWSVSRMPAEPPMAKRMEP